MTKRNSKKAGKAGGEKGMKSDVKSDVKDIMRKGEAFGDLIIGMMSLTATSWEGMGIAAVGLAKAVAALKVVAGEMGVNAAKLYDSELEYFEGKLGGDLEDVKREILS